MSLTAQTELLIQKGIRQTEDTLVTLIQTALDKKNTYGNLEESQFRNLVRVSETTESPEVVKNFLRYQVGRDQKREKWSKTKDLSLAETIITHIDKDLKPAAKTIADNVRRQLQNNSSRSDSVNKISPEQEKEIYMQLIRLYLGYGSRYLKYLNPSN